MARGSYNISVSNLEEDWDINKESEFESQECLNSCLNSSFLRSLSFHDRPRSSRAPTNIKLLKSQYKTLVSSSLENILSNPLPPLEGRSECGTYHGLAAIGVNSEAEMTTQTTDEYTATSLASHQEIGQSQLSGSRNWLENKYTRIGIEVGEILEKAIDVLRRVDNHISESLSDIVKPESIALESVREIYKNKNSAGFPVSEFDLPTELSSEPIYENWRPPTHHTPKDVQVHFTPQKPKDLRAQSVRQITKSLQAQSPRQCPKDLKPQCAKSSPKNLKVHFARQNPENVHDQSRETPKDLLAQSQTSNLLQIQLQESLDNLQAQSLRTPKNLKVQSQQTPKHLQSQSQQTPKKLLALSSQQTLKNLQSLLSSDANIESLLKPDSSVERKSKTALSPPEVSVQNDTTEEKSLIDFELPSDHEQFIKIIGALQNRCLEYREMIQDIAVSVLEECMNFSEHSINRMQHLRKQFESQKKNFKDFKELCCESVVFGPDSLSIDEKVAEVIQSFYLKLLQEENETFMTCLDFGLKLSEIYAKMKTFETESKKIIARLEKEILYLKKTSVGFKV